MNLKLTGLPAGRGGAAPNRPPGPTARDLLPRFAGAAPGLENRRVKPSITAAFLVSLATNLAPSLAAADASAGSAHVSVRLVPEVTAISPGRPFTVAIHMSMAPSWHTYWKNPGDSGMPTKVTWTLPDGFKAGELQWPAPKRSVDSGLALYGYEGEATFLAEVTPPPKLGPGRFSVNADVSWLECRDICIPGKARLSLALPSQPGGGAAPLDPGEKALFASARKAMPAAATTLRATQSIQNGHLVLKVTGRPALGESLEFFPETPGLIEAAAPQVATRAGQGWAISMKLAADAPPPPAALEGVLRAGAHTYRLSAAPAGASPRKD